MERSRFFNSVNGDRKYSAHDWERYFSLLVGNGYFAESSTSLQAIAGQGMSVDLLLGHAFINGNMYDNVETTLNLPLEPADGILNRIDRIVIRRRTLERDIKAFVVSSASATTPMAPPLQRDADVWELCVADIFVGAGVTSVSQGVITDQRLDSELCGAVAALINQIDTTAFNAQVQSWFIGFKQGSETEWSTFVGDKDTQINQWLNNLQNLINSSDATQLYGLINTAQNDINAHKLSSNAHTPSQVGADPVGSAATVQASLTTHINSTAAHTAANVGADPAGSAATAQSNAISTAQNALDSAVQSLESQIANVGGGSKKLIATFTTSGTFTLATYGLQIGRKIDAYIVGGGGGGSFAYSSQTQGVAAFGGGGGYCKLIRDFTLSSASYSIVVGAGGVGQIQNTKAGDGGNTTAFGVTANGGKGALYKGGDGGSGGGGGGSAHAWEPWHDYESGEDYEGGYWLISPGRGGSLGGPGEPTKVTTETFWNYEYDAGIGGGTVNYTPINPYDGIAYGCGGGGACKFGNYAPSQASFAADGGGAGGSVYKDYQGQQMYLNGSTGGGGAGGADVDGGNGGIGGGGGGASVNFYNNGSKGGTGGVGIVLIYA